MATPALDITVAKSLGRNSGVLVSASPEPQRFRFTFDTTAVITDTAKAATIQLQSAIEVNNRPDQQLDWEVIAELEWVGGRFPSPNGGLLLPPSVSVDYADVKGKRVRWVVVSDNTGITTARIVRDADLPVPGAGR